MILERRAKPTLTPCHLDYGDTLSFRLANGQPWDMTLLDTRGEILSHCPHGGATQDPNHEQGDIGSYGFSAEVEINGARHTLHRQIGTQASFYEPWIIDGVQIWVDAAACVFQRAGGFIFEKDWRNGYVCQPPKAARFAVQEVGRSICPEPVHCWHPNTTGQLDIAQCYNGEDCWMGPYNGAAAHCGLDINMPAGTQLTAPIRFDDHYLFNSSEGGYPNNRWRGVRRWADGAEWHLQCHHQLDMLVDQRTTLPAGAAYATGAGTAVGLHDHSHFMFRVIEQGGEYWLDPWILFWQAFQDRAAGKLGTPRVEIHER